MSTPPPPPEPANGKDVTGSLVWTLGAILVAVYAFLKASDGGETRTFYIIAGAVAVIVALVHGYGAWKNYLQSRSPTT